MRVRISSLAPFFSINPLCYLFVSPCNIELPYINCRFTLSIEIDMGCDKEMNSISKLLFLFCICTFTSSCLAPRESSPINTYDLGKAEQTKVKLNISTIDQNGPYNNKMIFRTSPENIRIDEFERWTQSPDLVLNNYLRKSFLPGSEYALEGDILTFENDLTTGFVIFTFHYKITKAGIIVVEDIFEEREKSDESAAQFAAAMAKLARSFVKHITQKITEN